MTSCITAIIKDEYRHLREWIDYHLTFGVDHFYILQDDSSEIEEIVSREVIQDFIDQGVITFYTVNDVLPETRWKATVPRQKPFYNLILEKLKKEKRFDWNFCIDIDEFIVLMNHSSINDFLSEFNPSEISCITFNQMCFGFESTQKIPSLSQSNTLEICTSYFKAERARKSVASVRNATRWHVHVADGAGRLVDPTGRQVQWNDGLSDYSVAWCGHYIQRSKEAIMHKHVNGLRRERRDMSDIAMDRLNNMKTIHPDLEKGFGIGQKTTFVWDRYQQRKLELQQNTIK